MHPYAWAEKSVLFFQLLDPLFTVLPDE